MHWKETTFNGRREAAIVFGEQDAGGSVTEARTVLRAQVGVSASHDGPSGAR